MTDRFFSDDELVAYLDGEEEFAPFDEIRALLPTDPALQKRLEALSIDRDAIVRGFQHVKPSDDKTVALPALKKPMLALNKAAAIAAIALLLGGSAGFGLSSKQTKPSDWVEYVAAYQALYINATLSGVNVTESNKKVELARVSSAIGKDIPLEILQFTNQADYKRAQILGFKGKPLIQLAFLSRTGEPIALCIFRNGAADADISTQRLEEMQSASWSSGGYGYLLIGSKDEQLINQMASHFITNDI